MTSLDRGHVVEERRVGIECYMGEHEGFSAVVKHRYSDFNVNEIDDKGRVVRLRCVGDNLTEKVDDKIAENSKHPVYNQLTEKEQALFSGVEWTKLCLLASDPASNDVMLDVTDKTKDERRDVHHTLRSHFSNLVSDTRDQASPHDRSDGKKCICVSGKSSRCDSRWPRDRPRFLHFTLYKAFMESQRALAILEQKSSFNKGAQNTLRKGKGDRSTLSVCGTKDKRARTTQRVSAKFTTSKEIVDRLNKSKLPSSRLAVGDFEYREESLNLGQHGGNLFTLALRSVLDVEVANNALTTLRDRGFINYFGLQRFGTTDILTSDVGLALVRRNFELAVDLVLKPRLAKEPEEVSRCRRLYMETRDPKRAFDALGRHSKTIEAHLLRGLMSSKQNLKDAFGWIPKNTRLMYLHSYQSLVWNKVVSMRMRKFGKQVLKGDLVKLPEGQIEDKLKNVDVVEDVSKHSIFDVVMPLPGKSVQYPLNEVGDMYTKVMAEDELDATKCFEAQGVNDGYALGGDYRRLVVRPNDMTWKVVGYDEEDVELIVSDVDLANGMEVAEGVREGGKFTAIILQMSLTNSTYATMALREAMRCDTSIGANKKRQHQHDDHEDQHDHQHHKRQRTDPSESNNT